MISDAVGILEVVLFALFGVFGAQAAAVSWIVALLVLVILCAAVGLIVTLIDGIAALQAKWRRA